MYNTCIINEHYTNQFFIQCEIYKKIKYVVRLQYVVLFDWDCLGVLTRK